MVDSKKSNTILSGYIDCPESVNFKIDAELMMSDAFYQLAVIDYMYLGQELEKPALPCS